MATLTTVPTSYWHALDDGRVQCDVCPRACKLREGQRGLCFVRAREGDEVVLTTYGRSSGFCVDPIEKKPLNHFLPGSSVLSFGTAGCNLACRFCQNWDISKSKEIDTLADAAIARDDRPRRRRARLPERRVHLQRPGDLPRVRDRRRRRVPRASGSAPSRSPPATSAREPAARALLAHRRRQRRPQGVHRGLLPPRLRRAPRARARHARVPRARDRRLGRDHDPAHPRPQRLRRRARRDDELGRRAPRPDVPMHFTAFHPDFKMLDTPPTPPATLTRARAIALAQRRALRLHRQRARPRRREHTCRRVRRVVIERDWYVLGDYRLTDDGRCSGVRHRGPRPVRRPGRDVGRPPPAGPARRVRAPPTRRGADR